MSDKWPRGCVLVALEKKIHILALLGRTPGAISPNFICECTMAPHLYSRFHLDPFRFGEI